MIDMSTAIAQTVAGQDLTQDDMYAAMNLIMTGEATDAQIGGFLVALRMKGETVDEITAAAKLMRELATKVSADSTRLVDTCGTGGSGINKFNVSTASALVTAAAGAKVAKHGNRGVSSKSGSADVLELAGAEIMLSPSQVATCIDAVGVGFLFALNYHSAMKYAIEPRRQLLLRTLFNLLGPLTNPAGAKRQLLGVYERRWLRPMVEVLQQLGSEHVMAVHSEDGLDEISISAKTYVAELKNHEIHEYELLPSDFGFKPSSLHELVVQDSKQSLQLLKLALNHEHEGASHIVTLNAGAAIYLSGQCNSLAAGVEMAADAIGAGLAKEKLAEFIAFTHQVKNYGT